MIAEITIKEVTKSSDGNWLNIVTEDGERYAGHPKELPDLSGGGKWNLDYEVKTKKDKSGTWNSIIRMWQGTPQQPIVAIAGIDAQKNRGVALRYATDLIVPIVAAKGDLTLLLVQRTIKVADMFRKFLDGEETLAIVAHIQTFIDEVKREAQPAPAKADKPPTSK